MVPTLVNSVTELARAPERVRLVVTLSAPSGSPTEPAKRVSDVVLKVPMMPL